jgi:radical SAM superfamily enzyme YgiQ (UPF0313 family)
MARLVRRYRPNAEILLGGHGAAIEGIEDLIPCDHVVRGEGVRWFQRYLGEDDTAPIHHPVLPGDEYSQIYGITMRNYQKPGKGPRRSATIVPGVGCVNGCNFCAATHFFGKAYTPFLDSAERMFQEVSRIADALNCVEFRVMDENLLKDVERARRFLELVEASGRLFRFALFSSAETIEAFGVENLVRLGVYSVWMGVESRYMNFEKNRGRDLRSIIENLQRHGIAVIASSILFLDEHTPETIKQDVDHTISMNACCLTFRTRIGMGRKSLTSNTPIFHRRRPPPF